MLETFRQFSGTRTEGWRSLEEDFDRGGNAAQRTKPVRPKRIQVAAAIAELRSVGLSRLNCRRNEEFARDDYA